MARRPLKYRISPLVDKIPESLRAPDTRARLEQHAAEWGGLRAAAYPAWLEWVDEIREHLAVNIIRAIEISDPILSLSEWSEVGRRLETSGT